MSTKNLSRTVIEGGRRSVNKWDRRLSNREYRSEIREYMSNVGKNEDYSDEVFEPSKRKVVKDFNDKLSPMYKWLHAQVGRPWNQVKSEVVSKFDTRTTAGRHIVKDHLFGSVQEQPSYLYCSKDRPFDEKDFTTSSYSRDEFFVDEDGILRNKKLVKPRYPYYVPPYKHFKPSAQITTWLNGRIIGRVGNKLFWFLPVGNLNFKCEWKFGSLIYLFPRTKTICDKEGKVIGEKKEWVEPFYYPYKQLASRQHNALSKKELEFWNRIPQSLQTEILAWSPLNPNPRKENRYWR